MKLHTDHLAYLIHLESGLNTEFFSALSATKKKLVLDLAEAKLVLVNDANQVIVASHVSDVMRGVETVFHTTAMMFANTEEAANGQTKQS